MKYAGSSIVTTYQVGATVYVIWNNSPRVVTVVKTETTSAGVNSYWVTEIPGVKFASADVYASEAATDSGFAAKPAT